MQTNFFKLSICSIMFFVLASCGPKSPDQKNGIGPKELNEIIDEMVKNKEIEKGVADDIKTRFQAKSKQNENHNKRELATKEEIKEAMSVNSVDLMQDIHFDRSLDLNKYIGKNLLIKNLLIKNIKTLDLGEGKFVKEINVIPFDPDNNSFLTNQNENYTYEYSTLFNKDVLKENIYQSFKLTLSSPDQMKKINALEWESIVDNNFTLKIDVFVSNFQYSNIDFTAFTEKENDMRAKNIKINLENAEIIK